MLTLKYDFLGKEEYIKYLPHPVAASKAIEDWYKKLPKSRDRDTLEPLKELSWADWNQGGLVSGATIKQCIPVRDYLTSGYIIPLWSDLAISMKDNQPVFGWIHDSSMEVNVHFRYQYADTPLEKYKSTDVAVPKLTSPWGFKTPKGYSSFFFSPWYYKGLIEILPAIVDTDTQHEVNFPFIYHGKDNEKNVIHKYTPVVQVIPFKRESWKSKISVGEFTQDLEFKTFLDEAYRKLRHKKKEFR